MAVLHPRPLQGFDSRHEPTHAVGGLFVADPDASPEALRAAIVARGVRALDVPARVTDLSFLEGLDLEFLMVGATDVDVAPLHTCPSLRSLGLDSWTGVLDPTRLPRLEWLSVTEVEPGQLDQLTGPGHTRLHHLSVGQYREPDLAPLATLPRLVHLEIVDSRSLTSLAGASELPALRKLDLVACPALEALDGLQDASVLTSLSLDSCRGIDDLAVVADLPRLRALKLDLRSPPPLAPLSGHPGLEYVWLIGGRRPAPELLALLDNPAAVLVQSSRALWMRTDEGWEHVTNIYAMSPEQEERYERLQTALWELMAW
jgi:hypothetical protein